MNGQQDIAARLLKRFKGVPNIELEDALEWVETAMNEHGYAKTDNVPIEQLTLILLYAEATGATQISLRTAYFFSFVDKDESVDKSMIAGEYRRIARDLWRNYNRAKEEGRSTVGGSVMHYMRRIDRP